MANLSEISRWEAGIYQWETSDPVQGGPNGIDNRPTRELANRTRWLYDELGRVKARMDDPNFYKSITVSDSKALFDAGNYLHIGADATGVATSAIKRQTRAYGFRMMARSSTTGQTLLPPAK